MQWKGEKVASCSSDIQKMMTEMNNLKTTLEQYLSVAKEKEKNRAMAIITKKPTILSDAKKNSS